MHTLVSVSLKFLLEIILALIWFVAAKKNSFTSVFIFFVIYLTLTLFSVIYYIENIEKQAFINLN